MSFRKALPLTGAVTVIGANSLTLSPISSAVASSYAGADIADVMVATAIYGLATACSALVLAPMVDRIGERRALQRAMALLAAALVICTCAPKLAVLYLGQALAGLAAGFALPAIYSLSGKIAAPGRESQTLSWVLTGWTVSLIAGASASAIIADLGSWRLVYGGLAAASGLLILVISRYRQDEPPRHVPARSTPVSALRVRGIRTALLMVAAYMGAFYGLYAYLGAHLTEHLRLSTTMAGFAPAAYGLGFGGAAYLGRLLDRHGGDALSPFIFGGLALVYCAIAASDESPGALLALCVAWGLANHIGLNLIVNRLAALDPSQSGAIMGLYSAVTYLAVTAGTLIYGKVFKEFGFAACALTSAACIAPALALSWMRTYRSQPTLGADQRLASANKQDRPDTAQIASPGDPR